MGAGGQDAPLPARGGHDDGGGGGFLPDLLARASAALIRDFSDELRERGTSLPVWRAIAALAAEPGLTVTGLADACMLQQPTMTKLLDRMERDGLAARAPDPRDRRAVRVRLTPEGEARAAALAAAAARHEAGMLARFPQAAGIKAVLRDVVDGCGAGASPPEPGRGGGGAA